MRLVSQFAYKGLCKVTVRRSVLQCCDLNWYRGKCCGLNDELLLRSTFSRVSVRVNSVDKKNQLDVSF